MDVEANVQFHSECMRNIRIIEVLVLARKKSSDIKIEKKEKSDQEIFPNSIMSSPFKTPSDSLLKKSRISLKDCQVFTHGVRAHDYFNKSTQEFVAFPVVVVSHSLMHTLEITMAT